MISVGSSVDAVVLATVVVSGPAVVVDVVVVASAVVVVVVVISVVVVRYTLGSCVVPESKVCSIQVNPGVTHL